MSELVRLDSPTSWIQAVVLLSITVWFIGQLVMPLVVWRRFEADVEPELHTCHEDEDVPQFARPHFAFIDEQVCPIGFERLETILLPKLVTGVQLILRLYANREAREMGMAAITLTQQGEHWLLHSQYFEISSRDQDGHAMSTRDQCAINSLPKNELHENVIAPRGFDSVEKVVAIHRAILRMKSFQPARLRLDTECGGSGEQVVRLSITEDFRHAIDRGFVWQDNREMAVPLSSQPENPYRPSSGTLAPVYRATLKGAYFMSWKQAFFVRKWLEFRLRRSSDRTIRLAGINLQE